jgi:hypothetical protein
MSAPRVNFLRLVCWFGLALALGSRAYAGPSVFLQRPPDPQAVDFASPHFPVHGDGIENDSPALQAAIDKAATSPNRRGIVFVGSGTYRLASTVNVWRGVRIIGYGAKRPVFVLTKATPGFQGPDSRYLFFFAGSQPRDDRPLRDGGASGFFSALVNVELEIADGNPAAVGVRFNIAQHSFLAHVDLRVGSARAGVEAAGNLFHHCMFTGGEYGIATNRTAAGWPFLLLDSSFSGQRQAAILTDEAGMTIVRGQFRDVPRAIEVKEGRNEQLWVRDSLFERISGPAITLSDVANARTQGNLHNVICRDVPWLLTLRETGENVRGPAGSYVVRDLIHGLQSPGPGAEAELRTSFNIDPWTSGTTLPPSDIPMLPPVAAWVDARSLGAKGDGVADDTAVLKRALQEHAVVYLPTGKYLVSDTLRLRPDGVLIGLHPATTQLIAAPNAPAFKGAGAPSPILASARGGAAILSGIGIDMNVSPRVLGVDWRAGAQSMINDVCFTSLHSARGERPAAEQRWLWDTQGHSLWINDGGGGTIIDIWTANTTARSGLYISDTKTSGRLYAVSAEHHMHREVRIERAANWSFYGLQTEAEGEEGPDALQLEIRDSSDLLFANLFLYRVSRTRTPYPTAIETTGCHNLQFRGLHVFSPTKFAYDHALRDTTTGRAENGREWASLTLDRSAAPLRQQAPGVEIATLATGFESIDCLAVKPSGALTFIDGRQGRIYEWQAETGVRLITESPIRPSVLATNPSDGGALLISRTGAIFSVTEKAGEGFVFTPLERTPRAVPGAAPATWLRSVNLYGPNNFLETALQKSEFAWLAGSVAIAADLAVYQTGNRAPSWSHQPLGRAYSLRPARPGTDFFMADEYRLKTYRFRVGADGTLENPQLFAEIGEADVVQDSHGRVYVAAGDLFVFTNDGRRLARISLPERPLSLVVGGPEQRDIIVAARTSLYRVTLPQF